MQPEVHPPQSPPEGLIRQLRPSDQLRFSAHLLRLDAESRRDRFNGSINDSFIDAYADRSFHDGTTVIGYLEGDEVLGAAELHERPDEFHPTAEIAFSVERNRQHMGIGGKLFARLIAHAHALGYTRLRVTTHADNRAMKALARRFEAHLTFEAGEAVGTILLAPVQIDGLPLVPVELRFDGAAI